MKPAPPITVVEAFNEVHIRLSELETYPGDRRMQIADHVFDFATRLRHRFRAVFRISINERVLASSLMAIYESSKNRDGIKLLTNTSKCRHAVGVILHIAELQKKPTLTSISIDPKDFSDIHRAAEDATGGTRSEEFMIMLAESLAALLEDQDLVDQDLVIDLDELIRVIDAALEDGQTVTVAHLRSEIEGNFQAFASLEANPSKGRETIKKIRRTRAVR